MSFRLLPKSVTLNDPEWHNGHYCLHYFTESVAFGAARVKVVEDARSGISSADEFLVFHSRNQARKTCIAETRVCSQ